MTRPEDTTDTTAPAADDTTEEPDASVFGEHAEYVTKLRGEAAESRRKRKEAEDAVEAVNGRLSAVQRRLLDLEVRDACRGVLADPSDLLAHVAEGDLLDDDGAPDRRRIADAAAALVQRKPHLGPRPAVGGDVDQGARPEGPAGFDFAGMLRSAAS